MAGTKRSSQTPESLANLIPFSRPVLSPSIGKLRDSFDIQSDLAAKTKQKSGTGSLQHNWQTVETMRGFLNPLSGVEIFQAQQLGHNVTHHIQMRFSRRLDTTMRLHTFDEKLNVDRYFTPIFVEDVQNLHTQLNIIAKEEIGVGIT